MRRAITPAFIVLALGAATLAAPPARFLADDPLAREPESRDASSAKPADIGLLYDLSYNLFVTAARTPSQTAARNVNTIDEAPDSSWFTNRILPDRPSMAALVRGPSTGPAPDAERWTIVREKSSGYAPGFTAKDAKGETWFLSFDAPGHPEGATGAMVVATKIFWALGYNQIDTFITRVDPRHLTIDAGATVKRPNGKRTRMRQGDVNAVLARAHRNADGTYRAAAGRLLTGKVLGPFRYDGTRPDDPNDLVDHEHRRELRALRVFGAWTNLTDLKAGNTLDTLVSENGRMVVRHYLQDVGSTFGIGANGPHDWDEGFEYFYEGAAALRRLWSLGLALSPWQTARYTEYPSIGRFESAVFDPAAWKPHTATLPYIEMQPRDAFWAARRVAAFDDDLIAALVHTGQYSDAAAERHLAATLGQRRDKIAKAYLPAINPIVDAALSTAGVLTFDNAAVTARAAAAPAGYATEWFQFDNDSGRTQPLGQSRSNRGLVDAPRTLPAEVGAIVQIDVRANGGDAAWQRPVRLFFRRSPSGWTLVGLERDGS
jgi:hypothetical protein